MAGSACVLSGAALAASRHDAYLPFSRQMAKCPFEILREPGRPFSINVRKGKLE